MSYGHPDAQAIQQNVNAARRPSLSPYLWPNLPLLTRVFSVNSAAETMFVFTYFVLTYLC
jgi:hypothetical protein